MEKYLIVGLGNVGDEYAGTRHNTGFIVLDAMAKASNTVFADRRYGYVGETSIRGRKVVLLKPSTYMNLSGNAVRYWMNKEHIDIERLLIVVDDLSLPLGALRLKPSGSSGGHNGLAHIQSVLGTERYCRLRVGIGSDFPKGAQIEWVLGRYGADELKVLQLSIDTACKMIRSFVLAGVDITMNAFNGKTNGQRRQTVTEGQHQDMNRTDGGA